jgi:Ca2+-binding EF-hand superfamily protein
MLPVIMAESRFTPDELNKIQKEFQRLSKDNVIGKRKLLEYFRLSEIQDTYLSNEVFFMIKNSSLLNSPIDYSKFINFVSTVAKGTREEKLQLLYTFFDKSVESKITKEDLKAHISGTIISMQSVSFVELSDIDKIKQ